MDLKVLCYAMTDLKNIISILFCLTCLTGFAQSNKTVDSLESQYQKCLDKGQYMLGCSNKFYNQMDSLLNVYYKKLRSACDSSQKENLKDEQFDWLAKREKNFHQNKIKTNYDAKKIGYNGGQDEQMIIVDKNAMFVKERVVMLSSVNPMNYSPENYKVNTTGFYSLDIKTETKNDDTYGYFGDIKVKSISNNKLVIRFFVCKGAPSYSSGSLADTLTFRNNKAVYKAAEFDNSCRIIFTFFKQGIRVEEITDDYNSGCGFGHAVIADGFFKRRSNKIPTTKDLSD